MLRLALVGASALAALAAHRLVAADTLSDGLDIALTSGALVAILVASLVALRLGPADASPPTRFAAPAALALVGALFVVASYADMMVAAQSLVSASRGSTAATIALGPRGDDVRLAGEIQEGAAARLAALLDAHPEVTRVTLTSEGGLADEGEALREVIAAHRLTTFVPEVCESACTLAFVGGRQRLVGRDARLGFHAPFEEGLFGQTFAGDKKAARAAYVDAGVDAAFVDKALDTAPDDMWYPEAARLVAAHVATAIVVPAVAAPAPHS